MSLIVGMKISAGRVLILGDSIFVAGDFLELDEGKVHRAGPYIYGHIGYASSEYAFRRLFDPAADWLDPEVAQQAVVMHVRRLKALRDEGLYSAEDAKFNLSLLLAKDWYPEILCLNQDGLLWANGDAKAIGVGEDIARYLLRKEYRPGLNLDDAVALGTHVIEEVTTVSTSVKLPVTWCVTSGTGDLAQESLRVEFDPSPGAMNIRTSEWHNFRTGGT